MAIQLLQFYSEKVIPWYVFLLFNVPMFLHNLHLLKLKLLRQLKIYLTSPLMSLFSRYILQTYIIYGRIAVILVDCSSGNVKSLSKSTQDQ